MISLAFRPTVDDSERERLRQRPGAPPVMTQVWRHLLFLHFPIEPRELEPLLAPGLEPDLFPDDSGTPMAWVGVVLFGIERIRTGGLPPIPGLAGFAEANVRTYVHRGGYDPSVLFLSLDGGPWITRSIARASYRVPYVQAQTALKESNGGCHFQSRRPDGSSADFRYRAEEPLARPAPGSLEFFLLERYQLLAPTRRGLLRARIWHKPYHPFSATYHGQTDLPEANGIASRPFVHAIYCDGVDSEFFWPERAAPPSSSKRTPRGA